VLQVVLGKASKFSFKRTVLLRLGLSGIRFCHWCANWLRMSRKTCAQC